MNDLNTQKGPVEDATSHPKPLPVEAQQSRGYVRGLIERLLKGNDTGKTNGTSGKAQPMSSFAIAAWDRDKAARKAKDGPLSDWI